jgi:hypothetical protein
MTTRILLTALAASASIAVAACGGGETPSSSGASSGTRGVDAKTKKAMLDFAKCMREHGVDMPDPQFEGGGVRMVQDKGTDPGKARAAEEACKHFQDEVKPPPMSEAQQKEMRERALANARCMRDHGVEKFPDPQFDADGRMSMRIGKDSGVDPEDPTFQAAQKACMKNMPMMAAGGSKP